MIAYLTLAFLAYVVVLLKATMAWQVEKANQGFYTLLLLAFVLTFGSGIADWLISGYNAVTGVL